MESNGKTKTNGKGGLLYKTGGLEEQKKERAHST